MGAEREASDPLAELARLVGQDDPYGSVFRPARAPASPPVREENSHEHEWHDDAAVADNLHRPGPRPHVEDRYGHADPVFPGHHPAQGEAWPEQDGGYDQAHADDERYYAIEAASHRDDAGIAEAATAVDGAEASIADLWARGDHGAAPQIDPSYPADLGRTRESGSARRPLLVLAAVLILTGGGLGASYLAKGGGSASVVAANGSGAPTILAATGPTKVKQDDPGATAPEDKDAALLSKGAGTPAGPVKVVQSGEQPADLGQLPKAADNAATVTSASPFPEAKKVKTFLVHPNGTPIYDDGQTAADASPPADLAPPAHPASTPMAAGKGTATPSAPTIASLVGDPQLPPSAAEAAPAPVQAVPKPVKPKAGAGAGGFGLQLAASPSEAEAHAAFAKLKKKYPAELGSLSANVHQSDTGGKPVYRVRVGGMTREDATALCTKLMAGGGSCFVVHD